MIVAQLGRVIQTLKEQGYTILLVEQNAAFAAPLADRMYIIEHGQAVAELTREELPQRQDLLRRYLGV